MNPVFPCSNEMGRMQLVDDIQIVKQSLLHSRTSIKGSSRLKDMRSLLHTLQFDQYEDDSDLPSFSASPCLEMNEMTELSINSQPEKVGPLE